MEKPKYKKVLFVSDIHAPYHDQKAVNALIAFAKWWKPEVVFFIGDVIDFYAISHFMKNPQRALYLQKEIDSAKSVMKQICDAVPNTKRIFIKGNHEARLQSYLWTRAAELSGLNGLQLETLMGFKELGIEYQASGRMRYHGVIVKHGDIVRKFPVYTAKAEYDATKMSGVSGHTHRIGVFSETNEAGEYLWMEIGCLAKLNPDYMQGKVPNWQQGFGIGFFKEGSSRFNLDIVRIIRGKAMYGGLEFS